MINIVEGGVTAPKGYTASGVACGLKNNGNKDLAVVCSEDIAVAAGVFTKNVVKGHSLQLTMEHIKSGYAKAVIINSGNANACLGEQGIKDANEMAELAAHLLNCKKENILIGSTGVIGIPLNLPKVRGGIRSGISSLSSEGGHDAAEAIMTTDLVSKEIAVDIEIQGERVRIGGMAKGSGMIHPNMATMISIITTDANISRGLLDKALKEVVSRTFNRVSVDGDTSVCDMVIVLANGAAENEGIVKEDAEYASFKSALDFVCTNLSRMIAKDGEGATKLIEVIAEGALNEEDAYKVVSSIAKSPLVKTAIFGEDANWGRIITAAGYSGADFDPNLVDIYIGDLMVCRNGAGLKFDEDAAKEILKKDEVKIKINLKRGIASDRIWTCDFSYDYVKINGSYRS
ncbi:MAG TPA: bifunctional glutamate N-acetyltransferase/amino-acid acetyltransferase ArgJ [Acetivibrio sp.]|nr:bifunctional glutamate N-acetyltransferase/amino-acid acetyltransferase ArgJ [Clostridium sp.]HOQ36310.1 bifunctional glutamate N-acetyltransferase/amino-acid acetyltransferase ArgJ [Acetivibrio sp.]HPT91324.1 bifunctional glutamate N-acetyltransferase/amino-acid acetyltransferase ArgJ [Acetivibrio sp.]HQA56848.1 bifunctional glutamate N-acetyltransferase/amino-acid acetyltransferase ArgJ [Acetivibrio sp.]